jgi:hypothetical protein
MGASTLPEVAVSLILTLGIPGAALSNFSDCILSGDLFMSVSISPPSLKDVITASPISFYTILLYSVLLM